MEEKAELHPAISQYHIAKKLDLPEKGLVDYIK